MDLWEALRGCRALVGNDSGVTHLAALAGAPFVAIFGPSDPLRWAPRKSGGGKGRVLREKTDCLPCFELESKNCDSPACLLTGVETAWQALMEVIERQ
jgi:ADP-heptose:LPS heptosyltransferase